MIHAPQELQDRLLDGGGLFNLRVAVEQEANVAEDEDVGQDEPEDEEGVRLSLLVCTIALDGTAVDLDEDEAAVDCPSGEKRSDQSHLGQ